MSFKIRNSNDKENTFINLCIFGDYKVGKTYLATTVERPLVISIEDGTLSLHGKGVDCVDVKTLSELNDLFDAIEKDKQFEKYQWIFLDTITELGQNIYPALKTKMDAEAKANGSKGSDGRQVWGMFGQLVGQAIKRMRALKKHTCVLAHPSFKDSEEGIEKRYPDIYGKSALRIVGWLDEIYYMHINDKQERVFLTQPTDLTIAGSRSGKLEKIEPADLGAIQRKILG